MLTPVLTQHLHFGERVLSSVVSACGAGMMVALHLYAFLPPHTRDESHEADGGSVSLDEDDRHQDSVGPVY